MRRRLIIIGIALLVLIVPGIIIIIAVNRSPKLQNTVLKVANINKTVTNTVVANTNTVTNKDPLAQDRATVIFTSRTFAERFGSGSNQNNFSNLLSAETYGTVAFNASLNNSITQQRKTLKTTPFQSTITKAMTISVTSLVAKNAKVTVTTQRTETIDSATRVYYQDLALQLLKVGNDWRVDAANWK